MPNAQVMEGSVTRAAVPGPVPQIEVRFRVEFTAFNEGQAFALPYWHPEVRLVGVPLPVAEVSAPSVQVFTGGAPRAQCELSFKVLLYPHLLHAIEAARTGDLKGIIQPWFHYVIGSPLPNNQGVRLDSHANAPTIPFNFSRDEWAAALDQLRYDGAWIVEVSAPSVTAPGWAAVTEHLVAADKALRQNQPQAAAQACRDAWEAASPLLVDRWEDAKSIMQRGSKAPGKYTTKAERVATVYDDVSLLLNDARFLADTAKHAASHTVSDDDALLIYRLSLSLIAYLSRQSKLAESPASA